MKKITINLSLIILVMIVLVYGGYVWANKSSTSIEVPESIPKGSEITIRVTVTYNANNFFHYTQWLQIMINGKELLDGIIRWATGLKVLHLQKKLNIKLKGISR
jgi:hypothetical protein